MKSPQSHTNKNAHNKNKRMNFFEKLWEKSAKIFEGEEEKVEGAYDGNSYRREDEEIYFLWVCHTNFDVPNN